MRGKIEKTESRERMETRKKSRMKRGRQAAFLLAAALLVPGGVLSGCRRADSQETAAQPSQAEESGKEQAEADIRTATETARGDASRMVESGGFLFFKYDRMIGSVREETGELKILKTFEDASDSSTFWVYRGGLYFDERQPGKEGAEDFFSLIRLDLETGEEEHLADLMSLPSGIYASEGRLYLKGHNATVIYALDENGRTNGELSPETTVYGSVPEGCRELFGGLLPAYVDALGYMPVQNDTCLVIAEADGANPREIPEITNTSSALFAEDGFFAVFRDGNGASRCCWYDRETLKPEVVFETPDNMTLLQYRDGYLYYMENGASETLGGDVSFYRIPGPGSQSGETQPELVLTVREEPGMTGNFYQYGNFYVAEDAVYCRQYQDYGVYMGLVKPGEEPRLLTPALFESPIAGLGTVEAVSETIPCGCGEITAGTVYAERLVFSGDDEATEAMNRIAEEHQKAVIESARAEIMAVDEAWIHGDSYIPYSMTYTLDGMNGIGYADENYCSIRMDGYSYSGGAHGLPFRDCLTFDRNTGELLDLADLTDNTQEELQALVGAAFRRLAEETNFAFESPENLEHTVSDSISYESPFYLSGEGIVFYFDPYTIAPYSEGFPEVTIPYGDLKMKAVLASGCAPYAAAP